MADRRPLIAAALAAPAAITLPLIPTASLRRWVRSGWRRTGPPRPPRRRLPRDGAFGAEDGWGCPTTGPALTSSKSELANKRRYRQHESVVNRSPSTVHRACHSNRSGQRSGVTTHGG